MNGASPPPNLGRWEAPYATGSWPTGGGQDKGYEGGDLNRAWLERFWRGQKWASGLFENGDIYYCRA